MSTAPELVTDPLDTEGMRELDIHTTERSDFKHCREKWNFGSPNRLNQEPVTGYEPFWFGTAIHDSIAVWYTTFDEDKVYECFYDHMMEWFNGLTVYDDDGTILSEPSEEDWEKKDELGNTGLAMLEQYILFSQREDKFEVVAIERANKILDYTLGDDWVAHYSFRYDGLVKDQHGRYWLLEHKTTSQFPGKTDYLMMDDQVGTYLYALQLVMGIKIEGVLYNFLKKKAPQPLRQLKPTPKEPIKFSVDKSQDTTLELAQKALLSYWPDGHGMPEKYREFLEFLNEKPNNFIKRETIRRNQKEIANIGRMLPLEIKEMADDPLIYRSPSKLCDSCIFFDPCLLKYEDGDWEGHLEIAYKQREERKVGAVK